MLSIEEIKLLIEKLEKIKGHDFQKLVDDNLKILKELQETVDATNSSQIERMNRTLDWFRQDENEKHNKNLKINFDNDLIYNTIYSKIKNFAMNESKDKTSNSLEIGPGYGRFSKCFTAWRLNYFVDILPESEGKIKKKFHPAHHKYIKFYSTNDVNCSNVPNNSINFVFSWDTFTFFSQEQIKEYLKDISRVLLPGGHAFIHYSNCEFDHDLQFAKKSYWEYNTKSSMTKIIKDIGYDIIEMEQFAPGLNYAVFKKPGKNIAIFNKAIEINPVR